MECSLALCFKDFAMLVTDKTSARSIMVMKDGKKITCGFCHHFSNLFDFLREISFFRLQQSFQTQRHNVNDCRRRKWRYDPIRRIRGQKHPIVQNAKWLQFVPESLCKFHPKKSGRLPKIANSISRKYFDGWI